MKNQRQDLCNISVSAITVTYLLLYSLMFAVTTTTAVGIYHFFNVRAATTFVSSHYCCWNCCYN